MERETKMREHKSKIYLPPNFKMYGSSEHVSQISTFLQSLANKPETTEMKMQMVIHTRDYIMLTLYYINALQASNLINITLQEVLSATRDKIIKDAFVFENQKYNVSIIYGSKLILAPENLYHHIKLNKEHLRPKLIDDKHRLNRDRYLFVSSKADSSDSKAVQLQHTRLAWCLTATCERSGVFKNVEDGITKMVSTSRIRFSVITKLVCLGKGSLGNIAYCFGNHTKEVCPEFYVQFWSNREAAQLSWKVHKMVISEIEDKAAKLREKMLEKKKMPEVQDIEWWITNWMNSLKLSRTDVDDPSLI